MRARVRAPAWRWPTVRRPAAGDLVAGAGVALVLVPQALAYAVIAGVPPQAGLVVGAVATLAAAPFVSSPWLQTGPVAITSLLTFGGLAALATPGSVAYVQLAALLAILVGAVRLAIGLLRAGALAYLMSQPVLAGFLPGAAIVIAMSQLPAALGQPGDAGEGAAGVARLLAQPAAWDPASVALTAATVLIVLGARRVHPLVPGVLIAVLAGLAVRWTGLYDGPLIGEVPAAFPALTLDLPWSRVPELVVPALVIALVGFAEASAISRTFAQDTRTRWDADREFVSQGVANLASGLAGGFPAGGSLSRSALNRQAGARTAWSGAVTGLLVLAFLPFAGALAALPRAVLAGVIISAVAGLARPGPAVALRRYSRLQFGIALLTFALTLALAPRVQYGVIVGVVVSIGVHLRRELMLAAAVWTEGETLHMRPTGVLYFASAHRLADELTDLLHAHPGARRLVLHLDGLGRVDVTGALALRDLLERAAAAGLRPQVTDLAPPSEKIVTRVLAGRWDDALP